MDMITQALRALADAHQNTLTPDLVVETARDPGSPLHDAFTWDDTLAAQEHRRNQARTLIRSVKVEYRTTTFGFMAPAFIRDPSAGRAQGYVSVGKLRTQEDAAREAVVAEFSRASAALKRAKDIAMALNMSAEIERLEADIVRLIEDATQSTGDAAS